MAEGVTDPAVRLLIRGRVQGVWFRAWAKRTARALGLDGWVRNRDDGTVEVVAAGAPAALEALIAACRQGPPAARVDDVERHETNWSGGGGFHLAPDE